LGGGLPGQVQPRSLRLAQLVIESFARHYQ
jgi:hypothetical protein